MGYGNYENSAKRTELDKVLGEKAFAFASNPDMMAMKEE